MALESALVDRARAVRLQPQPRRIAGQTLMVPVSDAWFDARLELPTASESTDRGGHRRRVIRVPTLMYGVLNDDGEEVVLGPDARVEVDSEQLGRAVWEVTGAPVPMRRREEVIGWEVQLQRSEDREFEPDAAPVKAVGASLRMRWNVEGVPPPETATGHLGWGQY